MHEERLKAGPTSDIVPAWLKNKEFERAAAYNNRGRIFVALEARELASRWKVAFAASATDPTDRAVRQLVDDLGSEFHLRGIDPPVRDCKVALEQLRARACIEWQKLHNDPMQFQQTAERFAEQLSDFQNRAATRSN